MRQRRPTSGLVFVLLLVAPAAARAQTRAGLSPAAFVSPAFPSALVAAAREGRLAWIAYEEGRRNVYTAAAPAWRPVRVTAFLDDDGTDLGELQLSADGSIVTFVRGHIPNRDGWVANPASHPDGAERAVWAAATTGGDAWRIGAMSEYRLSPDGACVAFAQAGQIHVASTARVRPESARERGETPFVRVFGTNSGPVWSPDGRRLAFTSARTDHSFVVIVDQTTRTVTYMAPSVDFDAAPTWSTDGTQIAFTRRPGLAFGQQAQEGGGGIGLPDGPARTAPGDGRRGARGTRGGRGEGGEGEAAGAPTRAAIAGLMRGAFRGGHTLEILVGDPVTGAAEVRWHSKAGERVFTDLRSFRWADGRAVFTVARPGDEWDRWFALDITTPNSAAPTLLTTTDGIIEDSGWVALSADGRTLFYATNTLDIDRRDVWAVPVAGGTPRQVTSGPNIETYPVALADGGLAVLVSGWDRPQSVALLDPAAGATRIVFPEPLPARFQAAAHVRPEAVTLQAADGFEFYNQVFVPKETSPGSRHPAVVFVHGGPMRQMLLGYGYRHFYHMAYGVNQWLASQGYVVLSVNYRSGIGYGNAFRRAPNTGGAGNAEYGDVLAAGKYLQGRPDVDPERIGIWGLSYGGVLTAQALARNSDIFKAGVDLAGVHLWGSSVDPSSRSFQSSVVGAIDGWKSPVLLVHGDDDRNVAFQQTTGLVQLLRARDVEFELIVFPDEVHDFLLHSRWTMVFERMGAFLREHLGRR